MSKPTRTYPLLAACGLNCGLCPRYYTTGQSRCPGCGGENFTQKHPPCGVLSCSQRREYQYCYQCPDYPCRKFDHCDQFDSFITHQNMLSNFQQIKDCDLSSYQKELNKKVVILQELLSQYDDGRHKSFYCLAVNLLPLTELLPIQKQLQHSKLEPKAKTLLAVELLESAARTQQISMQLRKK